MIKPTKGRGDNPGPTGAGQSARLILRSYRPKDLTDHFRMSARRLALGERDLWACLDHDRVFVESSWNKAHFMEMKQNSGGKWPHIGDPQLGGIVSSKNEHSRTHRPVSHRGLIGLIRSSRWGCLEQS